MQDAAVAEVVDLDRRCDARDYVPVLDVNVDNDDWDDRCNCVVNSDTDTDTLHNVAVTAGLTFRISLGERP